MFRRKPFASPLPQANNMTKEDSTLLHTLETRVRQLILQYGELEKENQELRQMLEQTKKDLTREQENAEKLRKDYANLKLARMMELGDDDVKDAKSRLSQLVREVDKCIALLNV